MSHGPNPNKEGSGDPPKNDRHKLELHTHRGDQLMFTHLTRTYRPNLPRPTFYNRYDDCRNLQDFKLGKPPTELLRVRGPGGPHGKILDCSCIFYWYLTDGICDKPLTEEFSRSFIVVINFHSRKEGQTHWSPVCLTWFRKHKPRREK